MINANDAEYFIVRSGIREEQLKAQIRHWNWHDCESTIQSLDRKIVRGTQWKLKNTKSTSTYSLHYGENVLWVDERKAELSRKNIRDNDGH